MYYNANYTHPITEADFNDWLKNKHNLKSDVEIKKFADKLKDIVCLLIGCTREELENPKFKEKELGEEWGVWKVVKNDGTQFGGIHENKKDAEFTLSICSWSNCQVVFEKMTPRKMLQQIGTDLFRNQLHPSTWTNATFADYQNDNWIITDVRFPNELEVIKKHNGITIRINRGLVERTGKMIQEPEHISEKVLDKAEFDYVIENNGTSEELIEKIKEILIKEEIING